MNNQTYEQEFEELEKGCKNLIYEDDDIVCGERTVSGMVILCPKCKQEVKELKEEIEEKGCGQLFDSKKGFYCGSKPFNSESSLFKSYIFPKCQETLNKINKLLGDFVKNAKSVVEEKQ